LEVRRKVGCHIGLVDFMGQRTARLTPPDRERVSAKVKKAMEDLYCAESAAAA
jgi:hypothetical protein